MTRCISDYEVLAHAVLGDGRTKLVYKDPSGTHEIHLANLKVEPGIKEPLLNVQVVFEVDDTRSARTKSDRLLSDFLNLLSLVTSCSFSIHHIARIIDWTPGLDVRDCQLYLTQSDPAIPFPILNDAVIESVATLSTNPISEPLSRCLRWYARGVSATYLDEQFQSFWFALELLAEIKKKTELVPDKCQKCGTALYCRQCEKTSYHRPFPRQTVLALINDKVRGETDKTFEILYDFRNAIMHARPIKEMEEKHKITFDKVVDIAGKIVFAGLVSSFKAPNPYAPLRLIEINTYAHKELAATAVLKLGSSADNKDDPKIENFRGTQFSIEVTDDPKKLRK